MQIDLSGITELGKAELLVPGTVVADVVKVKTPVDETLYCVTGLPSKLNVNGMVWLADQVGEDTAGPKIDVQPSADHVFEYSLSVFKPPGFPAEVIVL
jgi:hypothetical protein